MTFRAEDFALPPGSGDDERLRDLTPEQREIYGVLAADLMASMAGKPFTGENLKEAALASVSSLGYRRLDVQVRRVGHAEIEVQVRPRGL